MNKKQLILELIPYCFYFLKDRLILSMLFSVGKNVRISHHCHFTNPENVIIGDDVFINRNFYCSNEKRLIIKDRVMFGGSCSIIGGDHCYDNPSVNMRFNRELGINNELIIEEDAWIGHGCIILKNAFIGEGTIVGAGSVINSRLLPYSIYCGNPAKFIKPRFRSLPDLKAYLKMMKNQYGFQTSYALDKLDEIYSKNAK